MALCTMEEQTEKMMEQSRKIRNSWNYQAAEFCTRNGFDVAAVDVGKLNDMMQTVSLKRIADALECMAYGENLYDR